ncbi:hypothetical protein Tsubulata_004721 [Turnera subulata]|uniref:F-box domain-containing protein n=1 Tax=Turnera subulata TaxID=218843 RepID=A0A9Q0FHC3_9ROSI|nr:hypothetical protein Tsubulata_004721 [Turnera subulata]
MTVDKRSLIPYLWKKLAGVFDKNKKTDFDSLPDEIIIDILSRLPADFIFECRRVCKRWQALTRTTFFVELQLVRATPTILTQCFTGGDSFCINFNNSKQTFCIAEKKGHLLRMRLLDCVLPEEKSTLYLPRILQPECWIRSSCNGLILGNKTTLDSKKKFKFEYFICNPITLEEITFPKPWDKGDICGFYFHPMTKEYRILSTYLRGDCYQYVIINLPTFSRRELNDRFYCRPRSIYYDTPIIASGNLHWMVEHSYSSQNLQLKTKFDNNPCANSILRFNIHTESVETMPHPGYHHCRGPICGGMQLLEGGGKLSMCHMRKGFVDVWILVDYSIWQWIRTYRFNLRSAMEFSGYTLKDKITDFIWIQNDQLLLYDTSIGGLFVYNLNRSTLRKITLPKTCRHYYKFYAHTKSLVSLRKFRAD